MDTNYQKSQNDSMNEIKDMNHIGQKLRSNSFILNDIKKKQEMSNQNTS